VTEGFQGRASLRSWLYGLMVLTPRGDRVAALTGFADTAVFASFGLPRTLTA